MVATTRNPDDSAALAGRLVMLLAGQRVVSVFLGVVIVLSIFWYPLWSATQVPYDFYRLHNWMQGWV